MKKFIFAALFLAFASTAGAADVQLTVTVPDAWVDPTIAAINSVFPGREEAGMTNKEWAEYQIKMWLKGIVAPYKTRIDREAALEAAGYEETTSDEVLEVQE
jgi:hypothetical protein